MVSKYAILDVAALAGIDLEQTAHVHIENVKHSRDGTQVILEFPPGSVYYDAPYALTRAEAMELTRGENWGCPPEICGI
jgi:hypothetical protein